LQDPPATVFGALSSAESLADEEDEDDDDDDEASSISLLGETSLDGSSYSTGFMRGPHASARKRVPTIGRASLRMLERFTEELLDG
jgi:hypothetical protein